MEAATEQAVVLWPLLLFTAGAIGLILAMLGISAVLGGRHSSRLGNQPYESGIKPTGSARMRFSAKFYLVAIIFVLFDLEVVFIFAWAIAAPDLGWPGYGAFLFFLGILTLGLIYEWRIGALDWAPRAPRQYRLAAIENNRRRNLSGRDT
ncbi:NADH:ubiquinone oxidoreductase subunit A [Salinisphaera orenii MK-B5]|uniref:NADH-quinone oxidoreductase subunit A n=2 Tax=Salinisphaera orenii TaxID=856731 RepID=A0A423PH91_9GAMM|nr:MULTISPECIES: NADH-quinone oxidoreductase subunit A [Salinisphaera]ROO24925.1 NADH:ubiquinone oxidoreductase subunit A [Salinisphaera orenii MK-B5]ROO37769.1 NADH:ubiquinone oxidoreductase subunit A [Salinisphaera halophila YIM 95161]